MKSITQRILVQLGLSPKYQGFHAIVESVDLLVKDPTYKICALYATIGHKTDSNAAKVERNIRHAITVIYDRGNVDLLEKICGYNMLADGHVINGDFLHCLTMYIQEVHNNA